jgi:hypothetical protein
VGAFQILAQISHLGMRLFASTRKTQHRVNHPFQIRAKKMESKMPSQESSQDRKASKTPKMKE